MSQRIFGLDREPPNKWIRSPKSSAIPNFAKPGYSVEDFSDVVKHVVKSHFRPQFLKSQGRKVIKLQRVFGLAPFRERSDRSAPKAGALPTALHPVIKLFYPAGRIHPNQAPYQLGHTRILKIHYISFLWKMQPENGEMGI